MLEQLRTGAVGARAPLRELPAECRPATLDDAYAIQSELSRRLANGPAGRTAGWKIGCTTEVMQAYLGIGHPCAGRLYANQIRREHARLVAAEYLQLGLECELAVSLAYDLEAGPEPFDAMHVESAVDCVYASVEVVEHRFVDFELAGAPSLTADDFFSAGAVIGEPVRFADLPELGQLRGGFALNGAAPEHTGSGAAILGAPLRALAWLANHACAVGCPLRAGELLTLGSVVKTIYPAAGDTVTAQFDGLPTVRIDVV